MSIFGFGEGKARGHAHIAPTYNELTTGAQATLDYLWKAGASPIIEISNGARLELLHAGFITEEDGMVDLTAGGKQMATNRKLGD